MFVSKEGEGSLRIVWMARSWDDASGDTSAECTL